MKSEIVELFNEKMTYCCGLVNGHMSGGVPDQDLIDAIGALDYSGNELSSRNFNYSKELVDAVYFIKYGYAYAYEYHVMYDVLLKDYRAMQGYIFGVTCLGCGSLIDAWSLAYSKAMLIEDNGKTGLNSLELRYVGNDLEEWPIKFTSSSGNIMKDAYPALDNPRYPGTLGNKAQSIDAFFRDDSWISSYNTILFSKILNELEDDVLDKLIYAISDKAKAGKFVRDEYYICISISKYRYEETSRMKTFAKEIIGAINYKNDFDVKDDLLRDVNFLENIADVGDYKCYSCSGSGELSNDFKPKECIVNLRKQIKQYVKDNKPVTTDKKSISEFRYVTTRSQICLQVIKLTRKSSEEREVVNDYKCQ